MGFTRCEFLHDLRWWEVRSIIRGYRQRDRLKHQLMAECVYAATFAMRNPEGKTVADMFPMLFDEEDDDDEPPITKEDVADLQQLMANVNAEAEG